ncbi:MAG: hypothetical protein AB7S81_02865 [Bdellovibrionales bacterium]
MTSRDNLRETSAAKKWLFPMTLDPVFDEVFNRWAKALQEGVRQENGWMHRNIMRHAVQGICVPSFSLAHCDCATNVRGQAEYSFREPVLLEYHYFDEKRAHDFAHQVHAACVEKHRLTRKKKVIEKRIQQAITGTGNSDIEDRFKESGFVSSLAELIYQNVDHIEGGPNYLRFRVEDVVRKMDVPILRSGFDVRSFQWKTGQILAQAPFVTKEADTITVEEAQDFAGKVHQAFVLALTPA